MDIYISVFLTIEIFGVKGSALTPGRFTPHSLFGLREEKKILSPFRDPNSDRSTVHL
jgi:hypothetical protein